MNLGEYLAAVSRQLAHELEPVLSIKELTRNPVLLGAYTEAAVRKLVRRMVEPLRICTGAVIDHPLSDSLKQIDLIIWAPFPAPAIHEIEGFGLVPRSSAFGVLEIKRSNYSAGAIESLEDFLAQVDARATVNASGGSVEDFRHTPGLGVICVLENSVSARLQTLLDAHRVIAIFQRRFDDSLDIRHRDVFRLVNFLHYVTWRFRVQGSGPRFPQIDVESLPE